MTFYISNNSEMSKSFIFNTGKISSFSLIQKSKFQSYFAISMWERFESNPVWYDYTQQVLLAKYNKNSTYYLTNRKMWNNVFHLFAKTMFCCVFYEHVQKCYSNVLQNGAFSRSNSVRKTTLNILHFVNWLIQIWGELFKLAHCEIIIRYLLIFWSR